jgi:hypothetical protein
MAGGPLSPSSVYLGGASGNLFPYFFTGSGANAASTEEGIGVIASLGADAVAQLRFPMPPTIPSGTLKLMVRMLTSAASGTAKFTVSDNSCGSGTSPSGLTLTAETQSSVTFTVASQYLDVKVTLTTTPAANDSLVVAITFNHTSWTLAQILSCAVWVLWE